MKNSLRQTTTFKATFRTGRPWRESDPFLTTVPMTMNSTARLVERTRRDLLANLSDPTSISGKVEAYTAAVRRHRESIFADILRETRSTRSVNCVTFSADR